MTVIRQYKIGGNGPNGNNPLNMISGILMFVVALIIGYVLIKGIFTVLFWLSPILLMVGIALDPNGALNAGKSFLQLSKRNPTIPIVIALISALWFPVFPGILAALLGSFLIGKSFVKKKIKQVFEQTAPPQETEEFADYEEVIDDEDFLELPEVTPKAEPQQKGTNEYDNMF